jgi:hypothetical protein
MSVLRPDIRPPIPRSVAKRVKPALAYPLLVWPRRLTPAERTSDFESARTPFDWGSAGLSPPHDPAVREHNLLGWWPVLPLEVPQCPICKLPSVAARLCQRCKKLTARYGMPIDTLELLTVVNKQEPPEANMWHWKNKATKIDNVWHHAGDYLHHMISRLSAYVEAQSDRLLADDPVLTYVPSRAPLIAATFQMAADKNWYALTLVHTGDKQGDWAQHGNDSDERLSRTVADWKVLGETVAGRPVVLFDDVFLTGASMFSYATALKAAGATAVRGVTIGRDVAPNHHDYYDALRILKRTREFSWSPARPNIYDAHAARAI